MKQRIDPVVMPITSETPEERLANGLPIFGTPGQQYVESRSIPVDIAHDAGVRFDPELLYTINVIFKEAPGVNFQD